MTPVRAAIVGAGQIADAIHLPAMGELGLDLVAAVEVDPDRLTTFCDRWAIAGRYAELSAMLAAERPELVVICTPPSVHRDQVVDVLESGAWAWCEKPPALSLAEYDDITAAERDGGPYAPIVFQQRFGSAARHARALLTSGALGRPLAAHCQTTWWRGPHYFAVPWRGSFSGDGGPSMALGIHQIDLLLALLGPWQEAHAFAARLAREIETDDVSTATVRFESGLLATIVTSAVSPRQVSNLRIDTELATVEATYLYSYGNDDWTYTPAPGVDDTAWAASAPAPERSGHLPALRSVLADVEAGRRPETSGPGGRAALELITALYKSALTGASVKRGEIVPGDPFYDHLDGRGLDRAGRLDRAGQLDDPGDPVPSVTGTERYVIMVESGMKAVHDLGDAVSVRVGEVEIARYVYRLEPEPFEAPKPYLHPLRTLFGHIVTGYRPHDHRWHKGLQLTATDVSGHNLWGGPTYVDGQGYTALDNVGSMRPSGPVDVAAGDDGVIVSHALAWTSAQGERLATEQRELRFSDHRKSGAPLATSDDRSRCDAEAGAWVLDWASEVRNDHAEPLVFGSPATRGLRGSGYAGFWWRGPRSFSGGTVLAPSGEVDPAEFRGQAAPWLAFVGKHDGVDRASTLVFVHGSANDGTDAHWFVRSTEFAAVNPSWAFHRTFDLAPGETFRREYRVVVADGAWTNTDVESWLKEISQ